LSFVEGLKVDPERSLPPNGSIGEFPLRLLDHAQTDKAEKRVDSNVNNTENNMGYGNLCQTWLRRK
jgi:hypothetical protein